MFPAGPRPAPAAERAAGEARDVPLNDPWQYLPVTVKSSSRVDSAVLVLFTLNLLICPRICVTLAIPPALARYHLGEAAGSLAVAPGDSPLRVQGRAEGINDV